MEIQVLDNNKKKAIVISTYVLSIIAVLLTIILLLLLFVISPLSVNGNSMEPTLRNGEHLFIQKIGYTINRGDIIVLEKDPITQKKIVKRVIAIEGDRVKYSPLTKQFFVNGEPLLENYIKEEHSDGYISWGNHLMPLNSFQQELVSENGILVKKDELFILGDNRNISNDSHIYGCVNIDNIIGKYLFKY